MVNKKIRIFTTGGSFDKEHDPISEGFIIKKTHVPDLLKNSRSLLDVQIDTLMMIDSLDMTEKDQNLILKSCQEAPEDKIIVTHGTSKMEKTAQLLGNKIKDKTIILTGAMVPYSLLNSDALFNFGNAIAFVQTLPHGVYVAMNGKYYSWDNVTKNVQKGLFEEIKK